MTIDAGQHDIAIYKGATFSKVLTWKSGGTEVNLTGYTARMQVRESIDSDSSFISLTTENGGITLGGSAGTVTLSIAAATTAAYAPLRGVYDLELISSGGIVTRLLQGSVVLHAEVTR
jgi:hypothetical protein